MFERRHHPLLPHRQFVGRLLRSVSLAAALIGISLGLGIGGYHWTEDLAWLDSLLNASMILAGMGPIHVPATVAGKLFASFYALFSGLVFITVAGVLMVPVIHRLLHHFHAADDDENP